MHDVIGRYDVANPDFLVLSCLRADHEGIAGTYYADARDVSAALAPRSWRRCAVRCSGSTPRAATSVTSPAAWMCCRNRCR